LCLWKARIMPLIKFAFHQKRKKKKNSITSKRCWSDILMAGTWPLRNGYLSSGTNQFVALENYMLTREEIILVRIKEKKAWYFPMHCDIS
jgi:hypothetical protein